MARLGPLFLVTGKGRFDPISLAKSFTTPDFALFIFRFAGLGSPLLALDLVSLGLSLPVQSVGCLEPSILVLDLLHLGFAFSVRSLVQVGFSFPALTRSTFESPFLLLDFLRLEPSSLMRSPS